MYERFLTLKTREEKNGGPSCKTTLFLLMAISKPARSAGCDLAAERPRHWPRSGLVTLAAEHSANLITKHAAVRLKKPKIFFGRAPRARSAQPLRGSGAPRKAAPRPILALRLTRSASRATTYEYPVGFYNTFESSHTASTSKFEVRL